MLHALANEHKRRELSAPILTSLANNATVAGETVKIARTDAPFPGRRQGNT